MLNKCKVETPIHDDSIRELVTWECKEHGVKIIMNVLANPKGSVGCWNLNFWRLQRFYTSFWSKGCCRHLVFLTHRCIQKKQRNNCLWSNTNDGEKSSCIFKKNWEFYLVTLELPNVKDCHPPSLKLPMWNFGQLRVHCQPLCGAIIGVRIRSLSWIGVSVYLNWSRS